MTAALACAAASGTVRCVPPTLTMFHNPRCSKSRQALEVLQQAGRIVGDDLEIVNYRIDPPTSSTLKALIASSGRPPIDFIRTGPDVDLAGVDIGDADSVAGFLAAQPEVLQRPIVTDGTRSVIGRPPETVRDLLGG